MQSYYRGCGGDESHARRGSCKANTASRDAQARSRFNGSVANGDGRCIAQQRSSAA
jgi:hypothetical protein